MSNESKKSVLAVSGKIYKVGEDNAISDNFIKREFILEQKTFHPETGEEYANHIPFEVVNSNRAQLEHFKVGDAARVLFNVKGNLWTPDGGEEKAIVNLQAWKIEKLS